jgi:hypothetical protein
MLTPKILVFAAIALCALCACDRQSGNLASAARLRGCTFDDDCEAAELCVFRLCTPRCGTARSCEHGATCFDTKQGPACILREYNACIDDDDCPVSSTCRNRRCASDCNPDAGESCGDCQNGLCLPPGTPVATADAGTSDAGSNASCKPGTAQCQNSMVMQCDDAGQLQPKEACAFACKDGACSGTCKPGALRCEQLERQRCDDAGTWKPFETCRTMCTPDACETPCVNGTRQCNEDTLMVCRGGRMVALDTCEYVCSSGACSGVCTPGSKQCRNDGVITCSADALWSTPIQCQNACIEGTCAGECKPGATRCSSGTSYQTCDRRGQWSTTFECRGRACFEGACAGVCVPGATRCDDGVNLATCGPNGEWSAGTPCPTQACDEGVCIERCAPENLRCSPADPLQPQRCDAQGQWQNTARCMPKQACVEGACRGECAPGARRCGPGNSREFQVCGPAGEWQPPMPCGPDQRCGGEGDCGLGNVCPPGQSPTWWGEGDDVDRSLTDPRWSGMFDSFASSGQSMPASYAIVFDREANELAVSLRTRAEDSATELDFAYFGIAGMGPGMPAPHAVRIGLATSEGSDDPRALSQFTRYDFAMGEWTSQAEQPMWLEHPAAWVSSSDSGWVVSFRVDLAAAGVDVAAPFRVALGLHAENEFGELDWTTPATLSLGDLATIQPRMWPAIDVTSVMCAARVGVP